MVATHGRTHIAGAWPVTLSTEVGARPPPSSGSAARSLQLCGLLGGAWAALRADLNHSAYNSVLGTDVSKQAY